MLDQHSLEVLTYLLCHPSEIITKEVLKSYFPTLNVDEIIEFLYSQKYISRGITIIDGNHAGKYQISSLGRSILRDLEIQKNQFELRQNSINQLSNSVKGIETLLDQEQRTRAHADRKFFLLGALSSLLISLTVEYLPNILQFLREFFR